MVVIETVAGAIKITIIGALARHINDGNFPLMRCDKVTLFKDLAH